MSAQLVGFAAALCAGAGAWLLVDGPGRRCRARLVAVGGAGPPEPRRVPWPARLSVPRPVGPGERRVVLWCLAGGLLLGVWGSSWLPPVASLLLAPLAVRWWRGVVERREADLRRAAVIAFCASLAGELRAGRQPGGAVLAAGVAGLGEPGARVLAAARYGGDVSAALCAAAAQPGAAGLRGVAACWEVAVAGGASLATGLERVAEALRAEGDQEDDLRAQLAGPRTSALALAVLPLLGLLLGSAMGVEPLEILLGSPLGHGLLLAGVVCEWAGVAWCRALVRAAERGGA
ncbi:type II secretion system F family protein [Streptomyces hainanensis]|uniref:type II secretion system F family protein n=1 Tax=Streptomyces hainanensis TaxID=402648 RepID=UPI001FB6ACD4|nr:type II secretion system F family protein [Streptomyces hainanensis]